MIGAGRKPVESACGVPSGRLLTEPARLLLRRSGGRWHGTGFLLLCSVMLVKDFVEYRGWSSSRFHTVQSITSPVLLVALVLMGIGLVISLRELRKTRQAESLGG
jgi:hypothetical protein